MFIKFVLAFVVLCAVVETNGDRVMCDGCRSQYVRIKRGKYPGPPQRYYSRPPMSYGPKGAFSYTPPPAHLIDNDEPPYSGSYRPSKVSRRPNDGLGNEDINNLVKYLSKQDLDKIIEFAGGQKQNEQYRDVPFEKYGNELNKPPTREDNRNIYKPNIPEVNSDKYLVDQEKPYDVNENFIYHVTDSPSISYHRNSSDNLNQGYSTSPLHTEESMRNTQLSYPNYSQHDIYQSSPNVAIPSNDLSQAYSNSQLQTEESKLNTRVSYPNYLIKDINQSNSDKANLFTDSLTMKEEQLPRPVNLRDEDTDGSFTNNVPSIVKPDSNSYKVESFGDIPLMNYNSKLHSLSSYHVPHYTVTSQKALQSSSKAPRLEPAPPVSAAKEQSDAHLKAVRIWSHKSKGTAYTLHKDGTLSLELPGRIKPTYGHH